MAYIVQADLETELTTTTLAQLTAASGTTPDAAVCTAVIALAEAEVNSYLAVRIAVPVDIVTHPDAQPWLERLTLAVAVKRLWNRKRIEPPAVKDEYNRAIEQLKGFAAGTIGFCGAATPAATASNEPSGEWSSETLVGGITNMEGL